MALVNSSLQQVMLRVKDPKETVEFYKTHFGMSLIDKKTFPEYKFDLYFMATLPAGFEHPEPGTKEANDFLWTMKSCCLELTHNYGTETDQAFSYANGNVEPHRGFGHIGFIVDNIESFCAGLEGAGVRFQKKLTDGRMRNIAFVLDPTGYWIELLPRTSDAAVLSGLPPQPPTSAWPTVVGKPSFQQSMIRIRDPAQSVPFYERHFGMTLVCRRDFPEAAFSVYFLATLPPSEPASADTASASAPVAGGPGSVGWDPFSQTAWHWACASSGTFLELTHNHGTESDPSFKGYHNGNSEPGRGYGHIGFLTDSLETACTDLEGAGVTFTKRPHEGKMRGLAFAKDPDGYLIEIIQRGVQL